MSSTFELVIEPRKGWKPVDFRELWVYRELLGYLIWRDIKIRYKQTLLGGLWAVLQPFIGMLVFAGLFQRVATVHSNGSPYPLFVYSGLVIWTFFQNGVTFASNSFLGSEQMIRKIYFPRILVPLAQVLALVFDMLISLGLLIVIMYYYHWPLTLKVVWFPVFVLGGCLATTGLGFILASLNVYYRDVKYAVPFFTQMLMFLTPVLYPVEQVPAGFRFIVELNPVAGMVEGFRYSLLGGSTSWSLVATSFVGSLMLFVLGLFFIRRMESSFADVI